MYIVSIFWMQLLYCFLFNLGIKIGVKSMYYFRHNCFPGTVNDKTDYFPSSNTIIS